MKKTILLLFLAASVPHAGAEVYVPGLAQAKFTGASTDRTSDIESSSTLTHAAGTVMANTTSSAKDWNGEPWSWNDNSVFGYVGEMWFEAGKTYTFGKQVDDWTYVKIDGTVYLDNGTWNSFQTCTYTPDASGWKPVEFRFGNGTGGAGVSEGAKWGFAFNVDNNKTWDPDFKSGASPWTPVLDPGDASLLRYLLPGVSGMTVSAVAVAGNDLSVSASFAGLAAQGTLFAFYGVADAGTESNAWESCAAVATVPAGDTAVASYTVPGAGNAAFVAFLLAGTTGVSTPFFQGSDTFSLKDDSPAFRLANTEIGYTNLSFLATCTGVGIGASSLDASLVVARDSAFADVAISVPLSLSGLGSENVVAVPLATNTTYYARVVGTNDQTKAGSSGTLCLTTLNPGYPTGAIAFASKGFTTLGATGYVAAFGDGSDSAAMRLEASTDPSFATLDAFSEDVAATAGASAALSVSGLAPATPYYLRLRIVNAWGLATYATLADAYSTRDVPVAATGIGYEFTPNGSTVDFTFGVSEVYDGATCTAVLSYDGATVGEKTFSSPGTLSWANVVPAKGAAQATVTVTAEMDGVECSHAWTATVTPGASSHAISSLAELSGIVFRVGDSATLPELPGATDYYFAMDVRSFSLGADGVTLTALEPGFSAVLALEWNAAAGAFVANPVRALAVCIPEVEGDGRVFFARPGAKMNWEDAAKWRNLTDPSAAADFPRFANDVAMAALPAGGELILNADATVAELYIGPDENSLHKSVRLTGQNSSTLTFRRGTGKPGFFRLTGHGRLGTPALKDGWTELNVGGGSGNSTSTGLGIDMPGGLVFDGGAWPDYTAWDSDEMKSFGRARYYMGKALRFWNIPEGRTLRIVNTYSRYKMAGDDQGGNANFTWENAGQVTGSGTFLYDGAASTYMDDPFYLFEGVVAVRNKQKYDDFAFGSRGGSFWMVNWTQPTQFATNATLLVEGDAAYDGLGSSYGVVSYGNAHGYGSWGRTENALPAGKWIMNGGYYRAAAMNNNSASWREDGTAATQPICVPNGAETLVVSNGFSSISMGQQGDADRPTNSLAFARLEHAGDGTLRVGTDRTYNSYANNGAGSSWRVRLVLGGFHDHAIGGTGHAVARHGDASVRTNILEATAPIVPWIVSDIQYGTSLYFPGADDETDEIVSAGHPKATVLDETTDPTANVRVSGTSLALSADRTVNSLVVQNNPNKNKNLGEGRTLTIASGGLIVGDGNENNTGIGDKTGLENGTTGTLYFPRKAYIYAPTSNDNEDKHPAIWAPIVSPEGAVFSCPGDLHLFGDQTGIDGRISVNGTDLRLGNATTGCEIDVPVHLHGAFSRLTLGKQGSLGGQELWFWDHGTTGSKFVPADGSREPVQKLFVDGVSMPRGTYGSSASPAEYKDDAHFSGTGVIEVLADEMSGADVANLELVTCDDRSATIAFDLWPGFGSDRIDVYALVPGAVGGEVSTNRIYSSEEPADGRYEGLLTGLAAETSYTVRLLAVNESRGETFSAESPDTLTFMTGKADESPLVELDSPSSVGPGGATFPWMLVRTGSGHAIESIRLYWAETAAELEDLSTCTNVAVPASDFVPGHHATTLTGLRPGSTYYALLVAANDAAALNVSTSGPIAFATAAEDCPGSRPLRLGSRILTPAGLTAVVAAPTGEPAFPNVYAVWGARHAGENLSAWEGGPVSLGSMGTDAASLSAFLGAADLGDAVYVRFVGAPAAGELSWSESYYLPDIPVVDSIPPNVAVGSVAPGANDVTLSAYVLSAGDASGDGLVDVTFEYALDPDAFGEGSQAKVWSVPFTNGVRVGAVDAIRVGNLRAGRRHYARFAGVNDHDQRGAGDVFSFDTADGVGSGSAEWGLWQQETDVGSDKVSELVGKVLDESRAEIVEGTLLAYTYSENSNRSDPYYSAKTGKAYGWGEYDGWLYKGWMFVEGGRTYTFGSCIDDSCLLILDGETVISQTDWGNKNKFGTFARTESGWYPIDVRMGNGIGGAGPGDNRTFGLGFNTNGTHAINASAMKGLLDPGDGSLLRPTRDRAMTVVSLVPVGGAVSAALAISSGEPAGTLRAFWGDADGGTNVAAWASPSGDLAAIGFGPENPVVSVPVADPAATPFLRFAVVGADGEELWSPLLSLDFSQPQIGTASATTDGDRMTVSGTISSTGSGTDFALSVVWGYAPDLSDATSTNAAVVSAPGAFTATVPVLPGTNGWWRVVATTANGGYDATLPAAFSTKAGSVLADAGSTSVSHHDVTASGTLAVLGAGTTTVTLWVGDDAEHMAAVDGASRVMDRAGAFSVTGTIPGREPHTVYWKFVSVNVAPGGTTWTNETSVFTTATTDAATYTWKIEKTEGEWADADNWTASGVADLTDVLGYPDTASAKVLFVAGTSADIHVGGNRTFATMNLAVADLDLRFAGDGTDVSSLTGNMTGGNMNGSSFTFSEIFVRENDTFDIGANENNGAGNVKDVRVVVTDGAQLSFAGWWWIRGSNTWIEVSDGASIVWRNDGNNEAGIVLCNRDGGVVLDDGELRLPCFLPHRYSKAGAQSLRIGGAGGRVLATRQFDRWSASEDTAPFDFDLCFSVPLEGWDAGEAPIHLETTYGSDTWRRFGWRASEPAEKTVVSVSQDSPLVDTGRTCVVQLVEWRYGIDEKSVRLVEGRTGGNPSGQKFAQLYYTYGWPSNRKTKEGDELPTGIAARITGIGATILILR